MKKLMKKVQVLGLAIITLLACSAYSNAMMNGGGTMPGGNGPTSGNGESMYGGNGTTGNSMMQMPAGQQMYSYGPTTDPVMGTDLLSAMPIGVGSVAMGGTMLTLHAAVGQFANPMDMYFAMYAPAIDPFNIYMVHQDGTIQVASMGIVPWMQGVTGVDQVVMSNVPTSSLPKGAYTIGLMAAPTGSKMTTYYLWTTTFVIQ